jgi:DNA-binding winged helix-turn-helix (wHTH) protein
MEDWAKGTVDLSGRASANAVPVINQIRPSIPRAGGEDLAMRTHSSSCDQLTRNRPAFVAVESVVSQQSSSNSSTRANQRCGAISGAQIPPTLLDEMTQLLAEMVHSLVSATLEKMVDQMDGSSLRRDEPPTEIESGSREDSSARPAVFPNETMLRVGPLELDLIDRAAKRGDRRIDLRPREFQLLKYMMERSNQLLTRAVLLKEVWHFKFVPETNVVDVQMGLLRRKVDGANESPMIRSVRGSGFVLDATPLSLVSATTSDSRSMPRPIGHTPAVALDLAADNWHSA